MDCDVNPWTTKHPALLLFSEPHRMGANRVKKHSVNAVGFMILLFFSRQPENCFHSEVQKGGAHGLGSAISLKFDLDGETQRAQVSRNFVDKVFGALVPFDYSSGYFELL